MLGDEEPRNISGWSPSPPDPRDYIFAAAPRLLEAMPAKFDLSNPKSPVLNQGSLGSCGPHAAASDLMLEEIQGNVDPFRLPSRQHLYFVTRYEMGTVDQDSGVNNRSMLKAMAKYGWCDEALCPYNPATFTVKPSAEALAQGKTRAIQEYRAVPQSLDTMKACLVGGDAIIFGFVVYSNLQTPAVDASGDIPMPGPSDRVVGGHDVLIVGYDDATQRFKIKNSWGTGWGKAGYGSVPYSYALNPQLASDFWTITNAGIAGSVVPPDPTPAGSWVLTIKGTGPRPTVAFA